MTDYAYYFEGDSKQIYTKGFKDGVAQGRQETLEELMEIKAMEAACAQQGWNNHQPTPNQAIASRLKAAAIALGWKDPTGAEGP